MKNQNNRTKKNKHNPEADDDLHFEGLHLDRQSADGRKRVYKNDKGKHSETLLVFDA